MVDKKRDNSLTTLRDILFNELNDLRDGKSTTQKAIAVSKLSAQVIYSFRVEVEAVVAYDRVSQGGGALQHILEVGHGN